MCSNSLWITRKTRYIPKELLVTLNMRRSRLSSMLDPLDQPRVVVGIWQSHSTNCMTEIQNTNHISSFIMSCRTQVVNWSPEKTKTTTTVQQNSKFWATVFEHRKAHGSGKNPVTHGIHNNILMRWISVWFTYMRLILQYMLYIKNKNKKSNITKLEVAE